MDEEKTQVIRCFCQFNVRVTFLWDEPYNVEGTRMCVCILLSSYFSESQNNTS